MKVVNRVSLKSLYILSAISRHKSLKKAAEELCVTPSAISHQMNRLEQFLAVKLLYKEGKKVLLTDEARLFASELNSHFNGIESSIQKLLHADKEIVNFGVESAFAVNRFTSRLSFWLEENPNLDIRLRMLNCEDDAAELNLDIILSGQVVDRAYSSEFIADHKYIAVCNKDIYARIGGQSLEQTLASNTLLDIENVDCWQLWFEDKQLDFKAAKHIQYYSHTLLLLQAALAGQGIALIERALIQEQLDNEQLFAVSGDSFTPEGQGYYLSYKKGKDVEPFVDAIRELITSLIGADLEGIA